MSCSLREHKVDFPLLTIHEGMMFGSGGTGLFLWGAGRRLILTAGQGDLWDHRGGMQWGPEQNFADIRRALENNDPQEIERIFAEKTLPGLRRPTLLPLGRIEITLPQGFLLEKAALELTSGLVTVTACKTGVPHAFVFAVSSASGRHFACSGLPSEARIKLIPSYELCPDMAARKIPPPEVRVQGTYRGFRQKLPADDDVVLAVRRTADGFTAGCCRLSAAQEPFKSDSPV